MTSARITIACLGGLSALALSGAAARAGGLLLPGSGAVSTSRAGASVASVWGGDAIAINPAGLAIGKGTQITVSSALIDYSLGFQRAGTYDATDDAVLPWEGQPFPEVHDTSSPPIGLGPFQAVPLIAVASDLGGLVPGLYVGGGVWAPNAYPTRSIEADYVIDDPNRPPPPSRYDTVSQEAALVVPTIAIAYRILPNLDVGARFGWGLADIKAKVYLWGQPQNFEEYTGNESIFDFKGKDNFVPNFALGVRYRPIPALELGAIWSSQFDIYAKGIGIATTSANLNVGGIPVVIQPVDDSIAECAPGGTMQELKACTKLAFPMVAKVGARYVFRDADGGERGDVELDVDWEGWSAKSARDYEVVVDGQALGIQLKHTFIRHNFKDTFSIRLGGGYSFAVGPGALVARGGVAIDTAAAKSGWERLDLDGAARQMFMAGLGYRMRRWQVDVGGGFVREGSRYVGKDPPCNPTIGAFGCDGSGTEAPVDDRGGPDPSNPSVELRGQNESPFNQGTYKSHYVLLTLGVSTWF